MKYIVCWTSMVTGFTVKGDELLNKDVAEQIADDLNRKWPNLLHWIEPSKEVTQ